MSPAKSVSLVMLFHRPELITEFGAALWAAFQEVKHFYTAADPAVGFSLHRMIVQGCESLLSLRDGRELLVPSTLWDAAWGPYSGTIDHTRLIHKVRETLPEERDRPLLVVIDEELTPPEGFRYVMWLDSKINAATVLSLSTLDPQYWTEVAPGPRLVSVDSDSTKSDCVRKTITKRRARTLSLLIVGSFLGLSRCNTPNCFLYEQTTSVARIDQLVQLGPEHAGELPEIENVIGASFPYESANPEKVDSLIVNTPRGRLYAA